MRIVHGLAIMAALALGACVSGGGAYHPRAEEMGAGYSEQRLDELRWRVEFVGDASASQETVETHLLYRAAELTATSGYDWFLPSAPTLDVESEIVVEAARPRQPSPVWRPLWRHYSRFEWSDWMVRGGIPDRDTAEQPEGRTWIIDRYAAREDVSMGRGAPPQGAFQAREVLTQIGPSIERPDGVDGR